MSKIHRTTPHSKQKTQNPADIKYEANAAAQYGRQKSFQMAVRLTALFLEAAAAAQQAFPFRGTESLTRPAQKEVTHGLTHPPSSAFGSLLGERWKGRMGWQSNY